MMTPDRYEALMETLAGEKMQFNVTLEKDESRSD
jgi:hypothetical protein